MCDWIEVPETAPRSRESPSPQSTRRFLIALPFVVAGVTTNVKLAGRPTLGGAVGGVLTSCGATAIWIVTGTDTWPVGDGVVVVPPPAFPPPLFPPPPVAGGAVAPTVAVTVDCWLVVRIVEAAPSGPVVAADCDRTPAVVVNVTGENGSGLPLMSKTFAVTVVAPPLLGTVAGL